MRNKLLISTAALLAGVAFASAQTMQGEQRGGAAQGQQQSSPQQGQSQQAPKAKQQGQSQRGQKGETTGQAPQSEREPGAQQGKQGQSQQPSQGQKQREQTTGQQRQEGQQGQTGQAPQRGQSGQSGQAQPSQAQPSQAPQQGQAQQGQAQQGHHRGTTSNPRTSLRHWAAWPSAVCHAPLGGARGCADRHSLGLAGSFLRRHSRCAPPLSIFSTGEPVECPPPRGHLPPKKSRMAPRARQKNL